ncbi:11316_t:CDS:2 [Scutellospora calospora]|uniref:11316_t:CDS:1 n=1 Tax=Scutellospora calospora TaxID=85575 RepID=A0ACA9JZC4_9GLOM|nr:11316_t:CDS:2 [Scutellospora calospora]
MSLSEIQVNKILEKHMKGLEPTILHTKKHTHHENIRNHIKQYIKGTCLRNILYNQLYPVFFTLACGHLDTPHNRTNINKFFNARINVVDNDIKQCKTQNASKLVIEKVKIRNYNSLIDKIIKNLEIRNLKEKSYEEKLNDILVFTKKINNF